MVAAGPELSVLILFLEQQDGKPVVRIGAMQHRRQAEKPQLFLQPLRIEFAADFYQDFFVFAPLKRAIEIRKANFLRLVGDGVHFNLLPVAIEP